VRRRGIRAIGNQRRRGRHRLVEERARVFSVGWHFYTSTDQWESFAGIEGWEHSGLDRKLAWLSFPTPLTAFSF
jgi:hypothetical protein